MRKRNIEPAGQIENTKQDGRFNPQYISKYTT